MADEPAENISGGADGGGVDAEFAAGEASTRAEAVVDALGDLYWRKGYGGRDAFECLVRTVLSQNTSDVASQPAHEALMERYDGDDLARTLADADRSELADVIRPAGLYNRKSEVITEIAAEVVDAFGGEAAFDEFVAEGDADEVRARLLDFRGVGPKTADCVLLFSGGRDGVFPVDTHVHRIARRMGLAPPDADHETVRQRLEAAVPPEKCGFGHTATIQFGREYCTAHRPACLDGPEACPLYDRCDRVGVDERDGTVADPASTVDGSSA
ncbi:MAG: endonuclease III [Haloferacaceae archaeon]